MRGNYWASILGKLQDKGKMSLFPGVTEEQIAAFESANHVRLPLGYRKWLMLSDGGDLFLPAGVQLYGVAHKPVIDVDDDDRPSDQYVIIGSLSTGDPILCEKNSERISIYNHEAERIEDDEVYDNFATFLNDLGGILGIDA